MKTLTELLCHLIPLVRTIQQQADDLNPAGAQDSLDLICDVCDFYAYFCGYSILGHLQRKYESLVDLVRRQADLVDESKALLDAKSEANLQRMQVLVQEAENIDISHHPVVLTCREQVENYEIALEFIQAVRNEDTLGNLTTDKLDVGVKSLKVFDGIITAAHESLQLAHDWKVSVQVELTAVFTPMKKLLEESLLVYEDSSGDLKPSRRVSDDEQQNADWQQERVQQLRTLYNSQQYTKLRCKDTKDLFEDCGHYLTLLEEIIPSKDGPRALEFCSGYNPHAVFLRQQFDSCCRWAEVRSLVAQLSALLPQGQIQASDCGTEAIVETATLDAITDKLECILLDPPPHLKELFTAARNIIRVRRENTTVSMLSIHIAIREEEGGLHVCMYVCCHL